MFLRTMPRQVLKRAGTLMGASNPSWELRGALDALQIGSAAPSRLLFCFCFKSSLCVGRFGRFDKGVYLTKSEIEPLGLDYCADILSFSLSELHPFVGD